jgi:hypothetical protein
VEVYGRNLQFVPTLRRRRAADAKSEDADVTTLRIVDKFPLAKTAETYARMMSGKAEFRVVLTM